MKNENVYNVVSSFWALFMLVFVCIFYSFTMIPNKVTADNVSDNSVVINSVTSAVSGNLNDRVVVPLAVFPLLKIDDMHNLGGSSSGTFSLVREPSSPNYGPSLAYTTFGSSSSSKWFEYSFDLSLSDYSFSRGYLEGILSSIEFLQDSNPSDLYLNCSLICPGFNLNRTTDANNAIVVTIGDSSFSSFDSNYFITSTNERGSFTLFNLTSFARANNVNPLFLFSSNISVKTCGYYDISYRLNSNYYSDTVIYSPFLVHLSRFAAVGGSFPSGTAYLIDTTFDSYFANAYYFDATFLPDSVDSFESGYQQGFNVGHNVGYNEGWNDGAIDSSNYTFIGLIGSVLDVPVQTFSSLFNFYILGVNLKDFILGLFTICVILTIVKLVLH